MKKIKVAVCIDDNGGVLLFGKRQSRDRTLIADFVKTVGEGCVYVNQFSKALFTSYPEVNVCESPQDEAPDGCAVFAENIPLSPIIDFVDELIIYKWNRRYPSDVKIDVDPEKCGFSLCETLEFAGSSHEKITKEIYRRT